MSGRYRLTRSQKQLEENEENFDTTGEVEMFPGHNVAPHSRS
jgi:hypothetical protein